MAGVYGEINSRADFFRILEDAARTSKVLQARSPQDPTIAAIDAQLDAIKHWTDGGREPTQQARKSLDMGLRATRELTETGDSTIDEFANKIQLLHNYFEDWPTDEAAAKATDDDFFEGD
jgi:ABC-type transporter Mla subunit MlaD